MNKHSVIWVMSCFELVAAKNLTALIERCCCWWRVLNMFEKYAWAVDTWVLTKDFLMSTTWNLAMWIFIWQDKKLMFIWIGMHNFAICISTSTSANFCWFICPCPEYYTTLERIIVWVEKNYFFISHRRAKYVSAIPNIMFYQY